jgi:hypothetical protein
MLWCQRTVYPRLPIPFALHQLVRLLIERGAAPDHFKASAVSRVDIAQEANQDIGALARANIDELAGLLLHWIRELPNPIVPFELSNRFLEMGQEDKFLGFADSLPQAHNLVLLYIIGFLQDIRATADVAVVFGPAIVNPQRVARDDPARVMRLTKLAVSFVGRLIEETDATVIYPLNPLYLSQKQGPGHTLPPGQIGPAAPLDREPAVRRAPLEDHLVRSDSGSSGHTPVMRIEARPVQPPNYAADSGLDDQSGSDEGWEGCDGPV